MGIQFLPGNNPASANYDPRFVQHEDPELERARRVELYAADVDADPKLWLRPRPQQGLQARSVRTLDWWSLATRKPAEFESTISAAKALGCQRKDIASNLTKNAARALKGKAPIRCNGTHLERIGEARRVLTSRDIPVHVEQPDGFRFSYPSMLAAVNRYNVPRTSLREKLSAVQPGEKVEYHGLTWQVAHESEIKEIAEKFVPDGKGGLIYQWENAPAGCGLPA